MAHFAELDQNNIVLRVIVVHNSVLNDLDFPDSEQRGIAFCRKLFGQHTNWKQTSYTSSFRKNFAGVGFLYNEALDCFTIPQPYPSWSLTDQGKWIAPVEYPTDTSHDYIWNEETQNWVAI